MKKLLLLFVFSIFVSVNAFGQILVTVTGSTNTTPNLLPAYPSLALALVDLNNVSAMTGPIIFTLADGTSETAPPTGFVIGSATLNPVLSATNTVTIVKSGGTVTINAGIGTATPTSTAPDGMLAIVGADYVTIDGLTLTDGNVTNPETMEFGIGLFKLNLSDGAQNNTIQNCIFNMQRINNASGTAPMVEGSVGILVINSNNMAATTALVPDSPAGSNSNNKFYSNAINSGNYGIALSGYNAPSPFDRGDTGNEVGAFSLGNSILNFGGAVGATSPSAGVRANFQWGINISFNTINNNNGAGVNHVSTLRGIYGQAGVSANATIHGNSVTIHGGGTTSQVAAIENAIGSTAAGNTVNITNNSVTGDYLTATSGTFYGIWNSSTAATVNMDGNTITNMIYSGPALTGTGVNYMLYNSGAATNINMTNSNINSINRNGTSGGTLIGIYCSAGANQTVTNNFIGALSIDGTGTGGILFGIQTSTGIILCNNNTVTNLNNNKTTGTGVLYGIYNIASPTNENYNNNNVNNIIHAGTGNTYGIYTFTVTGTRTVSFNTVHTVSNAGNLVAGINQSSSSPNIFKNKIYNVSSSSAASPIVAGLQITSLGTSGITNVYNNVIGDIKAPNATGTTAAPVVRGINITSTTATSQFNLSFNSVYLNASSTGANFSSTALWSTTSTTATTSSITIRGNAFINVSTPGPTGLTNAYQRSNSTLTNYNSASDYNLFYAGTPGAQNLIYHDATNSDQTLTAFKTRVAPREANSVTENPTFLSTTASSPDFLRPDPTIATFMESGGITVTGIVDDYLGVARYPNAGYPNNPSFPAYNPDIGAFEFGGIWIDVAGPSITYTALLSTGSTLNRLLTVTITDPSGVQLGVNGPRLYYKKSIDAFYQFDNNPGSSGNDYTFTINNAALGGVAPGDIIEYYVAAQDLIGNMRTNPTGGSGINPPGTTPPGVPNSYNITNAPLSGTLTVGLTLFNRVTGKNLYAEERTRMVTKEIPVEEDQMVQKNTIEPVTTSMKDERVRTTTATVEEKYSVLMENGQEYTGSLYHQITDANRQQFGLSLDNSAVYATITAAFNDLNVRGVNGNTIFSLVDNTYPTETFPLIININNEALPGASSTVTLKPAIGIIPTISGSVNSAALLKINNSFINIDGSNIIGGSSRDLTITNTSVTAPSVIHFGSLGTTPLTNSSLRNSSIINGINSSTAVVVSDNVLGQPGFFNDITIHNNSIQRAYIGSYNNAVVSSGNGNGFDFTGNDLSTSGANAIRFTGVYVQGVNGALISQNQFANFDGASSEDDRGIWMATGTSNSIIERNYIGSLNYTGTGGYGAHGITVSTGLAACNNILRNNQICDLSGDGWVPSILGDNTHGIYLFSTQTGLMVYNNSINLNGNTLNQTGAMSYGITLGTGTTADVRNNAIKNNLGLLAATGAGATCMFLQTGASQLENSNYNAYYCNPTGSGVKDIGRIGTTDYTDLLSYAAATLMDNYSVTGDPAFISNSNTEVDVFGSNSWVLNGNGLFGLVSDDYMGNPRPLSMANDIGCFEFTPLVAPPTFNFPVSLGNNDIVVFGKRIGSLNVTNVGSSLAALTDINVKFHSGSNPPNSVGGAKFSNAYWEITPNVGASGYQYDITLNYSDAILGTITSENDIRIAKSDDAGTNWVHYSDAIVNTGNNTVTKTGLNSLSLFALSDETAPLPVELTAFTALINRRDVHLNWTTASEMNNSGFNVERKSEESETWSELGFISGNGTTSEAKDYSFIDRGLNTGMYNYRLKQVDYNGNFEYYNLSSEVNVGVPDKYDLSQNYPNPFNPTTKINFDLPFDSKVTMKIFDITGREIATLANGEVQTAGYYTVTFDARSIASGMYFYRIIAEGGNQQYVMTKKMVVVK